MSKIFPPNEGKGNEDQKRDDKQPLGSGIEKGKTNTAPKRKADDRTPYINDQDSKRPSKEGPSAYDEVMNKEHGPKKR